MEEASKSHGQQGTEVCPAERRNAILEVRKAHGLALALGTTGLTQIFGPRWTHQDGRPVWIPVREMEIEHSTRLRSLLTPCLR